MATPDPTEVDRALAALSAYGTTALATVSEAGPHVAGVFCAPERDGDGIRLVMALLRSSRKLRELRADPRVAFMCSPGDPSRWVQGWGVARVVDDPAQRDALVARLVAHAPGARAFVERLPVDPVLVDVHGLKVVEELGRPPLTLVLGASGGGR